MQSYARRKWVLPRNDNNTNDDDDGDERNFVQRLLQAPQREIAARLYACLYALILGVLDDFFANTVLSLFSDEIRLDLVTVKAADDDDDVVDNKSVVVGKADTKDAAGAAASAVDETSALLPSSQGPSTSSPNHRRLPNTSFGIGLGVGLVTGAVLSFFVTKN